MSELSDDDYDEEDIGVQLGTYDGERNQNGERHGFAKTVLPNGDTYEGQYENGKRHGFGTYRFKNTSRYEGEYENGKKHGQGTFWYQDGSRYEGSWVDDQRNGTGSYYYINGDIYQGEWYQHYRHGQGTYIYASTGSKYHGTWDEGKRKGSGEIIHENHRYVGFFDEDMPRGRGKYKFDKGCDLHGQYVIEEDVVENPDNEDEEPSVYLKAVWKTNGKMIDN